MSYRVERKNGKVELWIDNGEYRPLSFDCAHDLSEFIVTLLDAGQKTFPECSFVSINDMSGYSMRDRVFHWTNQIDQWCWQLQKQKKYDSAVEK